MIRTALLLTLLAGVALAEAPRESKRPVARAGTDARNAPLSALRPPVRAQSAPVAATPAPEPVQQPIARGPDAEPGRQRAQIRRGPDAEQVLRPLVRPEAISRRQARRLRGSVCGDRDLQGEVVGRVPGRIAACGIEEAVRVKTVAGIALSQPALMNCPTARALKSWTQKTAIPAMRPLGGLSGYRVAAHYACRTRNNQPGAKISEHGKGRAIDISAFRLQNGSTVTVLHGWKDRRAGPALRKLHQGACGPFGTVLGPKSNRFHQDHFHFDTARYRSGPYCR